MKLYHVGVRPKHRTRPIKLKGKQIFHLEERPGGITKLWTPRQMISGCGNYSSIHVKLGDLIYCNTCKEYFSEDQFSKENNK